MAEALGTAASALAVIQLCAEITISCAQYLHDVSNAKSDVERIQREVAGLKSITESVKQLLDSPHEPSLATAGNLRHVLEDSESRLRDLSKELEPSKTRKRMKKFGLTALKWPFKSKDVEKVISDIARFTEIMQLALQIDGRAMAIETEQKRILDKLPIADGATFDTHAEEHNARCLPNTRVDLLREITEWAQDPEAKCCFWLNGMAGTGKSTIARTLAHSLAKGSPGAEGTTLGASFFFKRGESDRGDVSKLFTTIASQLVKKVPETARHIQGAIDADPAIAGKSMQEQFERLIMIPLKEASSHSYRKSTLLVIIDALDECGSEKDVKILIKLLSSSGELNSPKLRIFCTSRPQLPLRCGFTAIHGTYQDLILHEVAESVIKHDISVFFRHRLEEIRYNHNKYAPPELKLSSNWPSPSDFKALVNMAVPLFIFAATISLFLEEQRIGSPDDQLKAVLEYRTKSQESQLDATYLPVLNHMIHGLEGKPKVEVLQRFRNIMGTIVILENSLSIEGLAGLLDLPLSRVSGILQMLHSVLDVPSSTKDPIRLFHLSFRDFLLDPDKRDKYPFWVDEKEAHQNLARHCLRVMRKSLHADMCDVKAPGTLLSSITPGHVNEMLSSEVRYACRFWPRHLAEATNIISDDDEVYQFLTVHFLHWLEVLGLLKRTSESIQAIKTLQSLTQPNASPKISGFLNDASRFILTTISIVEEAPLQLYSSALAFIPKRSTVRTTFENSVADWLSLIPRVPNTWNKCLFTLATSEGCPTKSIEFSHDSKLLLSDSSKGTPFKIWEVDTCKEQKLTYKYGISHGIQPLAFSHDSNFVASGSPDYTVQLWSAKTGDLLSKFEGHTAFISSIAYSHDSKLVASGSHHEIRIWNTNTGEVCQILQEHNSIVTSLKFSHDSKLLVSGSTCSTRVWVVETGELQRTLSTNRNLFTYVTFSHDSKLIAAANDSLKTWDTGTWGLQQTIQSDATGLGAVAFSHDSKLVATAGHDDILRIYFANTGEIQQTIEGHIEGPFGVAFSHDSKLLATSGDAIRVWKMDSDDPDESHLAAERHSGRITSIVFSHDLLLAASIAEDTAVRIWATDTGELQQTIVDHPAWVKSAAFSHDSRLIATASWNTIRICEVDSGNVQRILEYKSRDEDWDLGPVAFSHDSGLIAAASIDCTIQIWVTGTGEPFQTVEGCGHVRAIAFSHDSQLVASAESDKIRTWRTKTGKLEQTFEVFKGRVTSVAFSYDSKLIKLVTKDNTVRVWATDTGQLLETTDIRAIPHVSVPSLHQFEQFHGSLGPATKNNEQGFLGAETNILTTQNFALNDGFTLAEDDIGYGFNDDGSWIIFKGKKLLRLPVEYRATCARGFGSTVITGSIYGRICILRFDETAIAFSE